MRMEYQKKTERFFPLHNFMRQHVLFFFKLFNRKFPAHFHRNEKGSNRSKKLCVTLSWCLYTVKIVMKQSTHIVRIAYFKYMPLDDNVDDGNGSGGGGGGGDSSNNEIANIPRVEWNSNKKQTLPKSHEKFIVSATWHTFRNTWVSICIDQYQYKQKIF